MMIILSVGYTILSYAILEALLDDHLAGSHRYHKRNIS